MSPLLPKEFVIVGDPAATYPPSVSYDYFTLSINSLASSSLPTFINDKAVSEAM